MPDDQLLLVIFGAGASYDSSGPVPREPKSLAPPLAKDLLERHFDPFAVSLPASRPIINRLRSRMSQGNPTSLEVELARFIEEAAGSPEFRQQLVAFRFYLHRVIEHTVSDWLAYTGGFTHYLTLLGRLYEWHLATRSRVRLATFNYDTMLEQALESFFSDWRFVKPHAYIERDDFRLYKLHGSTTWSRVIEAHRTQGEPMVDAALDYARARLPTGGRIEGWRPKENVDTDGALTLPAMAVPMAAKTEFECPQDHLDALRAELPSVTHVLIVGWRAAEPHAVDLLTGSEPREGLFPSYALGIVGGSEQGIEELRSNLGIVAKKGRYIFSEANGFSAFILGLEQIIVPFFDAGWD